MFEYISVPDTTLGTRNIAIIKTLFSNRREDVSKQIHIHSDGLKVL
jgi:hypothetical protein